MKKNEQLKQLHQETIKADNKINTTIQNVYISLLNCKNNIDTSSIADDDKYIIDALDKIIYLIEVSQDYNTAFKLLDNLNSELSKYSCKHSYIK